MSGKNSTHYHLRFLLIFQCKVVFPEIL